MDNELLCSKQQFKILTPPLFQGTFKKIHPWTTSRTPRAVVPERTRVP